MAVMTINSDSLTDIADSIREKLGVETTYLPSEMAAAIDSITGITEEDEGKVVEDGVLVQQTELSVSSNGTYDTTKNNKVVVNVSGGGGVAQLTDYIESSGTQWVDTGYILSDSSKVEMVAKLQDDGLLHCILGVREVASGEVAAKGCLIYAGGASGNRNTLYAQFGSKQDPFSSVMADLYGRKCVYGIKTGGWAAKNFSTDEFPAAKSGTLNSSGHVTNVYSLYLFVLNNIGSAVADKASFRMYRLRIYEGDTLAMELLPHVDGGEACLRDTVTGNILRNSGTGSFTFGTDE